MAEQPVNNFYKKLNKSRNGSVPRAEMCRNKDGSLLMDGREVIKRSKQHFDEHLNGAENVDMGVQDNRGNDYVSAAEDGNDPAPTPREVKDAVHQLKTNKAAGEDVIAAELIKMGPEKLATCLHRLIVRIWETEQLPEEGRFKLCALRMTWTISRETLEWWQSCCQKREAAKVGLVVNASKTKYILVGGTEHDRIRLGSNVTIDGDTFEVVEEFVHLGSLLTTDNNMSREIRRRTVSGSRAYYGLQKNLRSKKIHLHTKCTMHQTLIRPVILYGHEPWIMLEEALQALGVFERRVLRTIFGGVQENGVWRRRMNHELAALYREPSIQKVAKTGRIR
ncbi:uncharacterized protein LOC131428778 [Malaya genurostris]|uniref:uncharacterized protein LOC131428778 n=1 Tax=Malaya genurostris TaxID=325434 RepID=UPI0026F3D436|nr:uncharacterized protein LOC131428778 [Malaya genurostris]